MGGHYDGLTTMNAIQVIYPYKHAGLWVFDDEGWLGPALLLYFESAPPEIYTKFEPKTG